MAILTTFYCGQRRNACRIGHTESDIITGLPEVFEDAILLTQIQKSTALQQIRTKSSNLAGGIPDLLKQSYPYQCAEER